MDNKEFLELMKEAKDKWLVSDFTRYLQVTQVLINAKETGDSELFMKAKNAIKYW